MVLRRVLYVVVLSLIPLMGISARHILEGDGGDNDNKELLSMLPRGIVPPSGPSPCHNMFDRKRTHFGPPPFASPNVPPFAPPFTPPLTPPFSTSSPFPFDHPPPPPPEDQIICP